MFLSYVYVKSMLSDEITHTHTYHVYAVNRGGIQTYNATEEI